MVVAFEIKENMMSCYELKDFIFITSILSQYTMPIQGILVQCYNGAMRVHFTFQLNPGKKYPIIALY